MEQVRPWHPFRVPGLCGMRGTTCILTILAVIICSISFYLTAELVQEEYVRTTANMSSNDTDHGRIRRSTPTIVMSTHGIDGFFVTVTEGSDVKFSCNPYVKNCPYCGRPAQASKTVFEYAQVYFCRDPWGDVKAYERPVSYGTDRRFGVAKNSKRGHNRAGMTVTITGVRATDQGKYCCGIDKTGTDWYEAFDIVVNQPVPEPVRPLIEPALEPATKEEMTWMGEGEAGKGGVNSEVRRAMARCQGNKACTLAMLQMAELRVNTSCWLCLQMSHFWKAAPLTVATVTETRCLIPQQMTKVLMAAADIERRSVPKGKPALDCKKNPNGMQNQMCCFHR